MDWSGSKGCSTRAGFEVIRLNSASSAVATGGVLTSQYPKRLDFPKNALIRLRSEALVRPDHAGELGSKVDVMYRAGSHAVISQHADSVHHDDRIVLLQLVGH